jgi:hypothetical protein
MQVIVFVRLYFLAAGQEGTPGGALAEAPAAFRQILPGGACACDQA